MDIILRNDLGALDSGRPDLDLFYEVNAVPAEVAHRVDVIVEELVSNAIRHGFEPGSDQVCRLRLRTCGEQIEIALEDDGTPFNLLEQAERPRPRSLETTVLGGLGIPLVRRFAAAIRYERPAKGDGEGFRPTNRVVVIVARGAGSDG